MPAPPKAFETLELRRENEWRLYLLCYHKGYTRYFKFSLVCFSFVYPGKIVVRQKSAIGFRPNEARVARVGTLIETTGRRDSASGLHWKEVALARSLSRAVAVTVAVAVVVAVAIANDNAGMTRARAICNQITR